MPQYKCNSCDKNVMYKSRGFIYFLFWPWTMLFMKKKCPVCGIEVQKVPQYLLEEVVRLSDYFFQIVTA